MPKLSDTMTAVTLVKWLKKEGDAVKLGTLLAEIETDKATMEFESFGNGVIHKLYAPAGSQVAIGDPLLAVGAAGEAAPEVAAPKAEAPAPAALVQAPPATTAVVATTSSPPIPMRLFLSYSSRDFALATQVTDRLRALGHEPWLAPRELRGGQDFAEEIMAALDRAEGFLLLLSPAANDSPHVKNELGQAMTRRLGPDGTWQHLDLNLPLEPRVNVAALAESPSENSPDSPASAVPAAPATAPSP